MKSKQLFPTIYVNTRLLITFILLPILIIVFLPEILIFLNDNVYKRFKNES